MPSNDIDFLRRAYLSIAVLYRFKFLILSLAIATETFSFYMEEIRAYSEYNLSVNSVIKKSLANKKKKKRRNSKASLEAVLFEKIAARKRNNLSLKIGGFSRSIVEHADRFFQNEGILTSDVGSPRSLNFFKPTLSRSPPFFSSLTSFTYL